jgi:hypothetical protein
MTDNTVDRRQNAELTEMVRCIRCKLRYAPTKSTSSLKLTYCSFLCELGDLGFSMQGLEHMERVSTIVREDETPEPVGVD